MNIVSGLQELQRLVFGHSDIKIAVLDGSVDLEHSCFNTTGGKLAPWHPQVQASSSPGLALKHGTAVCSLIFGQPGSAVEGVAPGCSGLIIPIYSEDDSGKFSSASQVELAKSIIIAVEQGANIINISGGQFSKTGDPEIFLKNAIDDCFKAGVLIVAATGNEGCRCLHVPAADHQVLAVGSLDENGEPTSETNFGDAYHINGILARGKNLTAAKAGGGTFQTGAGTSYATPIVSGVVGLLMSLQIKEGVKPDAYAIKSILESTATPCIGDGKTDCRRFLRGKLNLPAAMAAIRANPGILASGIAPTPSNKIIATQNSPILKFEELQEALQTAMAVVPTGISTEAISGILASDPEAITPLGKLENSLIEMVVEPSSQEVSLSAEEAMEVSSLALSSDPRTINPSEKEITISGESSPIINLKIKKMKNTENHQNTEMFGQDQLTLEPVLTPSGEIDPSDCGCSGKAERPALVYALGTLGYDFGSESHRNSFVQSMPSPGVGIPPNPHDPVQMLTYLQTNRWNAEELIWTLNIDATPIYALTPNGPYAEKGYKDILEYLEAQLGGKIERVAVPGLSKGSTSLLNGQKVANLFPRIRGMSAWSNTNLTAGLSPAVALQVDDFLNRIYYKMRNLGVTAGERALNYAATNLFQVGIVFTNAITNGLELHDISASKSPICRPGSDCYDVVLSFFDPVQRLTKARKEYRMTIDVSDIVPVTVGDVRSWSVY